MLIYLVPFCSLIDCRSLLFVLVALCLVHILPDIKCGRGVQSFVVLIHSVAHSLSNLWPRQMAIYQSEDYDSFFCFLFDLNDNVKNVLKPCFRQCQPHMGFLTAQQSTAVVSPEGSTGTTASTMLSANYLGSRLAFMVPYPATDPFQSSHRTSWHDQCHQNKM